MSALPRLPRLLVVIGIVSVAASVAPELALAERVTATLEFHDGTESPAPIRRARVEIWRRYGPVFPIWHHDYTQWTTDAGKIDFTVPASDYVPGALFGIRVYAINEAAVVHFRDRPAEAMYAQPGSPGRPDVALQLPTVGPNTPLDFSYEFTDLATVAYYNAADALLYGRDYAVNRRAEGETEPIKPINVSVDSANTFYDPSLDWLRINPGFLFSLNDWVVLHEYAHALEDQLSTFGPAIATWHDGCNVQLGRYSAHAESLDFAWMEGFAGYFAQAVARTYNTDKTRITGPAGAYGVGVIAGTPSVERLESPSCPPNGPSHSGEWLERFVGGALWDLVDDSGAFEPADRLCGKDGAVFSIFDRELQRRPPNIGRSPRSGSHAGSTCRRSCRSTTLWALSCQSRWRSRTSRRLRSPTSRSGAARKAEPGTSKETPPSARPAWASPATSPCRPTTTATARPTRRCGGPAPASGG